jgi:hypothetical protein
MWLLLLLLPAIAASSSLTIPHTDPSISYLGRFSASSSSTSFSWTHSSVRIQVANTTSVSATLSGGSDSDRFLVVLDAVPLDPFVVSHSASSYKLASSLDPSLPHTLELIKITEDNKQKKSKGTSTFSSFSLSPASTASLLPFEGKDRLLHFVGDSDTAGWCADGTPSSADDFKKTQNSHVTWAGQLARALDAEFTATAVSGSGVLDWPIMQYLDNTMTFDDSVSYDWGEETPDAVVILIGPNDSSDKTKKFESAYLSLLELLADRYQQSPVPPKLINVCGGSINGLDPCEEIAAVVKTYNSNNEKGGEASFVSIEEETWDKINKRRNGYLGCDAHYAESGHAALTGDILEQVREVMGW